MHDRTRSLLALVLLFTALAMGVLWWQSSRSRAELQDQVLLQGHLQWHLKHQWGETVGHQQRNHHWVVHS